MGRQKILNDCCCAVTAMLRQDDLKAQRHRFCAAQQIGSSK
jgi:hypothetical protein